METEATQRGHTMHTIKFKNGRTKEFKTLVGADLYGADMRSGMFAYADFRDADLRHADFRDADLTGADLTRANLRNANLTGAKLFDSISTDAIVEGVIMYDTHINPGLELFFWDVFDSEKEELIVPQNSEPYLLATVKDGSITDEDTQEFVDEFNKFLKPQTLSDVHELNDFHALTEFIRNNRAAVEMKHVAAKELAAEQKLQEEQNILEANAYEY